MADKVIVGNVRCSGFHGWRRYLEVEPQPFNVSAELHRDLARVAASGELTDTIDYAAVCDEARRIVAETSYAMIETLATALANRFLELGAERVIVRVGKLGVAKAHDAELVAIEVDRTAPGKLAPSEPKARVGSAAPTGEGRGGLPTTHDE